MAALVDNFNKEELEEIVKSSNTLKEVMFKIGYKCVNGRAGDIVKKRLNKYQIDYSHFSLCTEYREVRTFENSFCKNSTASQKYIRTHYLKEHTNEYRCSICGQESI